MDNLEEPARGAAVAPARAGNSQPVRAGHFELFASQRLHGGANNFQSVESVVPDLGRMHAASCEFVSRIRWERRLF